MLSLLRQMLDRCSVRTPYHVHQTLPIRHPAPCEGRQQIVSKTRPSRVQLLVAVLSSLRACLYPYHVRRRGFILLFGTRDIVSNDADAPSVRSVCPQCRQNTEIVGKRHRQWFTVFFIPVFPISGSTPFSQCDGCGAQFSLPVAELGTRLADSEREQSQRAIALYNSLRNSPANSITLNELMTLYAGIDEFDQAISAAG